MVVCIHYGEVRYGDDTISIVSQVCNGLERVAVPMFFLITGYYYPCLVERGQVNRQLTKLVKMALGASCLYALFYGFRAYFRGDISMWWGGIWRMSRMFSWWVFNKDPFGFHLWYFYAVLYDIVLFKWLDRWRLWNKTVFLCIGFIFLCGLLLNYTDYYGWTRNFLFFGLPYMTVGRLLGEKKYVDGLLRLPDGLLVVFFIVCNLLIVTEILVLREWFGKPLRDFYLSTLPLSVSWFLLAVHHPDWGNRSLAAVIGWKYSAYIFIFHVCVAWGVDAVLPAFGGVMYIVRPLLVFVCSLAVSYVWGKMQEWRVRWKQDRSD